MNEQPMSKALSNEVVDVLCPFGILQKTGTNPVSYSMNATIPAINTVTAENVASSSAPDKLSPSEQPQLTLSLFGESSLTIPASKESTAPCSETKEKSKAPSLSDRLTQSLISAGLVRGITPMSVRRQLGAKIPDIVFWPQVGENAV